MNKETVLSTIGLLLMAASVVLAVLGISHARAICLGLSLTGAVVVYLSGALEVKF